MRTNMSTIISSLRCLAIVRLSYRRQYSRAEHNSIVVYELSSRTRDSRVGATQVTTVICACKTKKKKILNDYNGFQRLYSSWVSIRSESLSFVRCPKLFTPNHLIIYYQVPAVADFRRAVDFEILNYLFQHNFFFISKSKIHSIDMILFLKQIWFTYLLEGCVRDGE